MKNYCVDNICEWPCSVYAVKPEMHVGAHYPKRTGSAHSAKLLMDVSSLKVAFTCIIKRCWMMKSYFEDKHKYSNWKCLQRTIIQTKALSSVINVFSNPINCFVIMLNYFCNFLMGQLKLLSSLPSQQILALLCK